MSGERDLLAGACQILADLHGSDPPPGAVAIALLVGGFVPRFSHSRLRIPDLG
jgi:hypothetical protein